MTTQGTSISAPSRSGRRAAAGAGRRAVLLGLLLATALAACGRRGRLVLPQRAAEDEAAPSPPTPTREAPP